MRRREFLLILAGLFLILFAVRLALVLLVAPETPFYDEWDSVIDTMARSMLTGDFSPWFFLAPHNEHTLAWTKLLSYLQLRVGGMQFDNVPVCEVNQFLYAGIVAALIAAGAKNLAHFKWGFIACAGLIAVIPYGWENIGLGWGNPYYFLLGFSTCTIILASIARSSPCMLVLLGLSALAAGISMVSGLFAGIAALIAIAMRVRVRDLTVSAAWQMAAVLFLAMAMTAVIVIHPNRVSLGWGILQSGEVGALALLWFPTWILSLRILRGQANRADIGFVCISLWGLAQIGSILLGRPEFRLWLPISRYIEILGCAAFANLGCLCRLAIASPGRSVWTWLARGAMAATIVAALAFAPYAWHWMDVRADNEREQTQRLIRYIHEGDIAAIAAAPVDKLPYPSPERLRHLIDAADVRFVLGDRAGTRTMPSAFVEQARNFDAILVRYGDWLLPMSILAGLLTLANAHRVARAESIR